MVTTDSGLLFPSQVRVVTPIEPAPAECEYSPLNVTAEIAFPDKEVVNNALYVRQLPIAPTVPLYTTFKTELAASESNGGGTLITSGTFKLPLKSSIKTWAFNKTGYPSRQATLSTN